MSTSSNDARPQPQRRYFRVQLAAIGLSMAVGVALLAAKFFAYHLTGSSAILSDALESIINVAASGFALISIVTAARPPDESHPYGHGKIEFFSAGFEGALIILAAAGIFYTGIERIFRPQGLPNLGDGIAILGATAAINLIVGVLLFCTGKKTDSLTLVADGKHLLTDVYTSGGIIVGLFLVPVTGWYRLDGVIACLVGINILVTGVGLVRTSFAGLMDESDPVLLEKITELLSRHRKEIWIDIHQLRSWKAGNHVHIDLHLVLPRDLDLYHAHEEAKQVELILANHFEGNAGILVHIDPCTAPDCPVCQKTRCEMRSAAAQQAVPWNNASLTATRSDDPVHSGIKKDPREPEK